MKEAHSLALEHRCRANFRFACKTVHSNLQNAPELQKLQRNWPRNETLPIAVTKCSGIVPITPLPQQKIEEVAALSIYLIPEGHVLRAPPTLARSLTKC